jgi:hypothetical protein
VKVDCLNQCRRFGIARQTSYNWKTQYEKFGDEGLINDKLCPENPGLRVAPEIQEKIIYLRMTYHFGSDRIAGSFSAIIRVLQVHPRHEQTTVIEFINHVIERFPFRIHTVRTDDGHEFPARFHWNFKDSGI